MDIRLEMMYWMIGCHITRNISQSSLTMKGSDHPSATIVIKVNRPTDVPIALHIPSSVKPASVMAISIHHSISLKDGMDNFSNPPPSWILVSNSILVMVVCLALQTKALLVQILSSALWIHLA
jgi:hypothetical protein